MTSAWEIKGVKTYPRLGEDGKTDVCVIGGGLAGVWASYLLAKEGKKVMLLEKEKLGHAATLYTTGFITEVIDTDILELVRIYGEEGARLSWVAGEEAIELINEAVEEHNIDCEFMRLPFYTYVSEESELKELEKQVVTLKKLGLKGEVVGPVAGFKNAGALRVPDQAKYHPIKFFWALVKAAEELGVEIHEDSEVKEVKEGEAFLKSGQSVKAKDIVLATYEPLNNPKPVHFKKAMYTSYVYELSLPKDTFPDGMFVDDKNPYHYFRFDNLPDKERVIVGGEDHRAELDFEGGRSFKALHEFIDKTFPDIKYDIEGKWSGGILESSDGLPLIGSYAQGLYMASAFSGNGMTYSAISGKILCDQIVGRGSGYTSLYDPKRKLGGRALLEKFMDYGGEFFGAGFKNLFKK